MPEVRYPFTVTVNPCVITSMTVVAPPIDVIYTLGDPATSMTYQIDQTPDFCYTETILLTCASFVTLTAPVATSNQIDFAYTEDRSLIGTTACTLSKEIS